MNLSSALCTVNNLDIKLIYRQSTKFHETTRFFNSKAQQDIFGPNDAQATSVYMYSDVFQNDHVNPRAGAVFHIGYVPVLFK